mgnify:CR=1 FL=1
MNNLFILGAVIAAPFGFIIGWQLAGKIKGLAALLLVAAGCLLLWVLYG